MSDVKRMKHLEMILGIVERMARSSFLLKGWSVTLAAGILALGAKNANRQFFLVAYLPVVVFGVLDGYYLSLERRCRALYNDVRTGPEDRVDFSMDTSAYASGPNSWLRAIFSRTNLLFYLTLAVSILVVILFA